MTKKQSYTPPGFPLTETELIAKAKGGIARMTLWRYRRSKTLKEGIDWIKVGSNVFYSKDVVQKIIKSTR